MIPQENLLVVILYLYDNRYTYHYHKVHHFFQDKFYILLYKAKVFLHEVFLHDDDDEGVHYYLLHLITSYHMKLRYDSEHIHHTLMICTNCHIFT